MENEIYLCIGLLIAIVLGLILILGSFGRRIKKLENTKVQERKPEITRRSFPDGSLAWYDKDNILISSTTKQNNK